VRIENLRVSVRFDHVIFPINLLDFTKNLATDRYQLISELPRPDPKTIGRLSYSGNLAVKGTAMVDVNSEKQFFGVTDSDPGTLLTTFEDVYKKIHDIEKLGGPLNDWFFEIQGKFVCDISSGTRKKIPVSWSATENEMGAPLYVRGIRVASEGTVDSTDYFDLTLEPIIGKENRSFDCVVILRGEDLEGVTSFLRNIQEKVEHLAGNILNGHLIGESR
jgi:hypothetical protein